MENFLNQHASYLSSSHSGFLTLVIDKVVTLLLPISSIFFVNLCQKESHKTVK